MKRRAKMRKIAKGSLLVLLLALSLFVVSSAGAAVDGQESVIEQAKERLQLVQAWQPPESPEAEPIPVPPGAPPRLKLLEAFPIPDAPPQPETECWDYLHSVWCDEETHQRWKYWCHRCCNHPDHCPSGCCDIHCWWVEAGDC